MFHCVFFSIKIQSTKDKTNEHTERKVVNVESPRYCTNGKTILGCMCEFNKWVTLRIYRFSIYSLNLVQVVRSDIIDFQIPQQLLTQMRVLDEPQNRPDLLANFSA